MKEVRREIATNVYPWQSYVPGSSTIPATAPATGRSPHLIVQATRDLVLGFGNFINGDGRNPIESPGPTSYLIKASAEFGGKVYPFTFRGQYSTVLDGGANAFTDPLKLDLPAGSILWIRTFVSANGLGWFPNSRSNNNGGGALVGDHTGADAAIINASDTLFYAPASISGLVPTSHSTPSVAIVGDSIAYGQNDSNGNYGYNDWSGMASTSTASKVGGYIERGLGAGMGRVNISQPSRTLMAATGSPGHLLSDPWTRYCTHVICELGSNDIAGGNGAEGGKSLEQVQSRLIALWTNYADFGRKVWQVTFLPRNSSADSWSSTAGQSVLSFERVRTGINDWIRAGAPIDPHTQMQVDTGKQGALVAGAPGHPLAGFFETADRIETDRNSGVWKTNGTANYYTNDGIHPTAAGHALVAGAIDGSRLR